MAFKLFRPKYRSKRRSGIINPYGNPNYGYGGVQGTAKKLGQNFPQASICLFVRTTRQLLWETKSKADGTYAFKNVAVGLECFVVALDPNGQYNAVISDKLVAK